MSEDDGDSVCVPDLPGEPAVTRNRHRLRRLFVLLAVAGVLLLLLQRETETSALQSVLFHRVASGLSYRLESGPSDSIRFPTYGPYDQRRGFVLVPTLTDVLRERNFRVSSQARLSPDHLRLIERGLSPVYHEKSQAGLRLIDRQGRPLYEMTYPERVYASFDSIPSLIVRSLLHIEDRRLLDLTYPRRNPAVDWERLARVFLDALVRLVHVEHHQAGGSTLATQIEKFRHSLGGRTGSAREKAHQMIMASLRAYLDGRDTREVRKWIVRDYLNSVPLAASGGFGEIIGLADGLWVWYGADFDATNRSLRRLDARRDKMDPGDAEAFKRVLSLLIAHRRPSLFLITDRRRLETDTNRYLRLLAEAGIISAELRDVATSIPLEFRKGPFVQDRPSFIERKAANAVRTQLLQLLGVENLYALDRIDLSAETTLDAPLQRRLSGVLQRLEDPAFCDSLSLFGPRMLRKGDPTRVIYSFTLYEAAEQGNLLRVQVDNYDQPLDINQGVRLELGSSAKLRTLANYLEIIAELHARHARQSREELRELSKERNDPIRRWVFDYLLAGRDTTLTSMLEASLDRSYSASPRESFFTGTGVHTFSNFDPEDDTKVLSVREAFRNSVNLVFIRLMRDIVRYYQRELPDYPEVLENPDHPKRNEYLTRFASDEGVRFLEEFYSKYRGKSPDAALDLLARGKEQKRKQLAAIFRGVEPQAGVDSMSAFLARHLTVRPPSSREVGELYERYSPDAYDLHDMAYLAGVHPLELWLMRFLREHPDATWSKVQAESDSACQQAYKWLFRTKSLQKQNKRIGIMLEKDAFGHILRAWQRVGYPFETIVPSYATAIGSSADRPAALAELIGIVLHDGVRYTSHRLTRVRFGMGTPYETVFDYEPTPGQRVLPVEVCRVLRQALIEVVEQGTARRCARAYRTEDGPIPVGGKTGTGDQRYEVFGRGGQLIESRIVSRTATFVFLIGDRFYGAITAYVPGAAAADYRFTSALPVQLFASLAPYLGALIKESATDSTAMSYVD